MEEIKVPIYLITGFLESGKTSFLSFTLQQDYFQVEGKTLLILCEEGEEEYDEEALKKSNTVVEVIDSEEELTPERWKNRRAGVWNSTLPVWMPAHSRFIWPT